MADSFAEIDRRMKALDGADLETLKKRNAELGAEKAALESPEYWARLDEQIRGYSTRAEDLPSGSKVQALPTPASLPPGAAPQGPLYDAELAEQRKRVAADTLLAQGPPAPQPSFEPVTPVTPASNPGQRHKFADREAKFNARADGQAPPKAGADPVEDLMKTSKDKAAAGFSGLAEMDRMKAAKAAGQGPGAPSSSRGRPIADIKTRMQRMAISANRRGLPDLAESLERDSTRFATEQAYMDELNRDDNPLFDRQFKDLRDLISFEARQLRRKSEEEVQAAGRN